MANRITSSAYVLSGGACVKVAVAGTVLRAAYLLAGDVELSANHDHLCGMLRLWIEEGVGIGSDLVANLSENALHSSLVAASFVLQGLTTAVLAMGSGSSGIRGTNDMVAAALYWANPLVVSTGAASVVHSAMHLCIAGTAVAADVLREAGLFAAVPVVCGPLFLGLCYLQPCFVALLPAVCVCCLSPASVNTSPSSSSSSPHRTWTWVCSLAACAAAVAFVYFSCPSPYVTTVTPTAAFSLFVPSTGVVVDYPLSLTWYLSRQVFPQDWDYMVHLLGSVPLAATPAVALHFRATPAKALLLSLALALLFCSSAMPGDQALILALWARLSSVKGDGGGSPAGRVAGATGTDMIPYIAVGASLALLAPVMVHQWVARGTVNANFVFFVATVQWALWGGVFLSYASAQ